MSLVDLMFADLDRTVAEYLELHQRWKQTKAEREKVLKRLGLYRQLLALEGIDPDKREAQP